MKLLKIIFIILISVKLTAIVLNYSELPADMQRTVKPDMEGKVLLNDLDPHFIENTFFKRDLPQVADGWPVSYTSSNCHNGAIYVNMDSDAELEILFGVGTKITALNLDGSLVHGWPVQLNYYIWSSPACGDIDGDGEIEIVCTSRDNSTANSGALYAFELDGTACSGFPVIQAGGGTNDASLYDLDSDGDMEILVNVRNHPQGWVYVFDGDGSVYEGFPQELDYIPGAGISVGDITGDGIPEIVALSYNSLHVYDLQGNILDGFPLGNTGYTYSYSQPILYDLDNDGLREIIWGGCSGSAGAVFAVNQDASSVTGWPQTTNYWIFGTVSIGDVDQDGSLDVVVGDQVSSGTPVNQIYVWDSSGNAVEGFPAGPTNAIYAQIGIADLDGDGNIEMMIDDNNFEAGYNCYNHDGTQCVDWPLACGTAWSSTTMGITPVFGDVDNDNELEIMGASTDIINWVVECYLWETGTAWNDSLAYMIVDGCNMQHNGLYAPSASTTFEPPQNLEVEHYYFFPDNIYNLSWQEPEAGMGTLINYNIYVNDEVFATVDDNVLEFSIINAPINANAESIFYITALYENPNGESEPSNSVTCVAMLSVQNNTIALYNFSNYPNPFNPTTAISFDIEVGSTGILSIYTIRGQLIESHEFNSGKYVYTWNAKDHGSGIYFYKLKTGDFQKVRKMLLIK